MRCRWGGAEVPDDQTEPSVLEDGTIVCPSFVGADAKSVTLYVSLNTGQDFHSTGQTYVYYPNPTVLRTGCLGAKKGCLIEGPNSGGNPVQVLGTGFDVFVDYPRAKCRSRLKVAPALAEDSAP